MITVRLADLVLNTARVHRWHHSPRAHESFANFSPTLTLWDWPAGTARLAVTVPFRPGDPPLPTRPKDPLRLEDGDPVLLAHRAHPETRARRRPAAIAGVCRWGEESR